MSDSSHPPSPPPRYKSELARKSNFDLTRDCNKLVGKNLQQHILKSEVDQFVFFGSVDDQVYKREEFMMFAKRFRLDYWVEIYEFDTTENDVALTFLSLEYTPALYFFPAGDKTNPILFRGKEFNNDNLAKWLGKVVTRPFTGIIDNQQHGRFWQLVKYNVRAFFKRGPKTWFGNVVRGKYQELPEPEIIRRLEEKSGEL